MLCDLITDTGNCDLLDDITFTVEDGINVAVSCCAAWSFTTSDIASVRVVVPSHRFEWLSYVCF